MTRNQVAGAITAAALVGFAGCSDGLTDVRKPTSARFSTAAVISATASGPAAVYPSSPSTQRQCPGGGSDCYVYVTYNATASGGTAPYTYTWEVLYSNGRDFVTGAGSQAWYQFEIWNTDAPQVSVRAIVHSADGSQATSNWVRTQVY